MAAGDAPLPIRVHVALLCVVTLVTIYTFAYFRTVQRLSGIPETRIDRFKEVRTYHFFAAYSGWPESFFRPMHSIDRTILRRQMWADVREERPVEVRHAEAPNPQRGANGRQPLRSAYNPESLAAASRRSP